MLLTTFAISFAAAFYGALIVSAHRNKVPVLELTKDAEVPKEL